MLYPLKFRPIVSDKIWGGDKLEKILKKESASEKCGESWEISGVQGNISVVENGFLQGNNLQELIEIYMGDLIGDSVYQNFGVEFPLLIKFIDANDVLSVQVHPDDQNAKERHNAYGKTEMWYVLQADEGAQLISGFKKNISKEELSKRLELKTLTDVLNFEDVKQGDVFFIPAGRIHAIGKGILLAEIQQTSDITYRVYDWDRKSKEGEFRELHTELALDVIDYDVKKSYRTEYQVIPELSSKLIHCKYFNVNTLEFSSVVEKDYHHIDSFIIYMNVEGLFNLEYGEGEMIEVIKGETVLLPASLKNIRLIPKDSSKLLEIYIQNIQL